MGKSAQPTRHILVHSLLPLEIMAPMKVMKAKKGGSKVMTKGALAETLASGAELKKGVVAKLLDHLATIAGQELKSSGKFIIPGICRVKTRLKPARKAGVRMAFGKEVRVKAQPAKTVVKAFCVQALKNSV